MSRWIPRRWWLPSLLGLLTIGNRPVPGERSPAATWSPILMALDTRLEPILRASVSWEARQGPNRAVVDLVCLVPDLPTFFEAVSTWDRGHYFPVLFDDVESSFRFIRAFRPARIVRMSRSRRSIGTSDAWARAVKAVGDSWKSAVETTSTPLRGDEVPGSLGPTPPGVVLSSPGASMLAGAVALAAGRFEPLLRLEPTGRFADVLTLEEADGFAREVARKVDERVPDRDKLGDDCDFVTLAADYPFRYGDGRGDENAVDDRVGRPIGESRRWAFVGRMMGGPAESVYRAMCSLFLQPESALMFNTYDEKALPWAIYETRVASRRLGLFLPTAQVSDVLAGLEGWHESFDPSNRFGLVMVNSMGPPTMFGLRGRQGRAPDIPRGVPSAVVMIHSYSAANPYDESTIAGRWLANGAFVYYGSINEPFVDAFRTPYLVGDLIARRVPLVAAVRELPCESKGLPWRLAFLGDPLYRIKGSLGMLPDQRLDRWGPTDRWPSLAVGSRPPTDVGADLLRWSLDAALVRLERPGRVRETVTSEDLVEAVLAVRRDRLTRELRPILDALTIEILFEGRRRAALKARLAALPVVERSPSVARTLETLEAIDFFFVLSQNDFPKAGSAWLELMRSCADRDFKDQAGELVAGLAATPAQLEDWCSKLRAASRDYPRAPESEIITARLKQVEQRLKAKR